MQDALHELRLLSRPDPLRFGSPGRSFHVRSFLDLLGLLFQAVQQCRACGNFMKLVIVRPLGELEWAQIRDKDLKVRVSPRTVP